MRHAAQLEVGQRFGRLVAREPAQVSYRRGWVCVCDCGNTVAVPAANLESGKVVSCGCLRVDRKRRELRGNQEVIHG
jgi:hypothetical protein